MPELSQALAAQGNSGDIKVVVNQKMGFTLKAGSHGLSLSTARGVPAGSSQVADVSIDHTISNSPIIPEVSSSWNILRLLLAALVIGALMYFFVYSR